MSLGEDKHKLEERYDLLSGEKASIKDQVTSLDGEMERLSQQVETLVVEKKVLEGQVMQQGEHLAIEELERRILEVVMTWLLQKDIVHVVDRVIENTEFTLGVR